MTDIHFSTRRLSVTVPEGWQEMAPGPPHVFFDPAGDSVTLRVLLTRITLPADAPPAEFARRVRTDPRAYEVLVRVRSSGDALVFYAGTARESDSLVRLAYWHVATRRTPETADLVIFGLAALADEYPDRRWEDLCEFLGRSFDRMTVAITDATPPDRQHRTPGPMRRRVGQPQCSWG